MHMLDLPIEILQLILDNLDLQHQIIFKKLCTTTYQLDITNMFDTKSVIKSKNITEDVLNKYPIITRLNLHNNRYINNINLNNIKSINIVNTNIDCEPINRLYNLEKLHMSANSNILEKLKSLNINLQIKLSLPDKFLIKEKQLLHLFKHTSISDRLNMLNELTPDIKTIYMVMCSIKYSCIDSLNILLAKIPAASLTGRLLHIYYSILEHACLNCGKSTDIAKLLLQNNTDYNSYRHANVLSKICTTFKTKTDVECVKLLLDNYKGDNAKLVKSLTAVCKNCNNKYSQKCMKFFIDRDVDPTLLYEGWTPIGTLIVYGKTVWALQCVKLLINKHNVNNIINSAPHTLLEHICFNYDEKRCLITKSVVEYVVGIGANINFKNIYGNNSLSVLTVSNSNMFFGEIIHFVANKNNVNCKNSNGFTPLMNACHSNNINIAKSLLDRHTDPNILNNIGYPALTYAFSNPDLVKILLNNNANVNIKCVNGCTPLIYCSKFCNKNLSTECIKILIEHGADIDSHTDNGQTALTYASRNCGTTSSIECVKLLINSGAKIDHQDNDGMTSLMHASRYCSTTSSFECVKLLINYNAKIDLQDNSGWSALAYASRNCNTTSSIECVKLLINSGAKIDVLDTLGWSPLMYASSHCTSDSSVECVKILIDSNANINIQNGHGLSPLMCASVHSCNGSSIDCVNLLIDAKADVNIKTFKNNTALMLSLYNIETSSIECVKLLINNGTNLNVTNIEGLTALMIACKKCNKDNCNVMVECVQLLIDAKADLNIKSNENCTALIYFCKESEYSTEYYSVLASLIKNTDLTVKDASGKSAYDYYLENSSIPKSKIIDTMFSLYL